MSKEFKFMILSMNGRDDGFIINKNELSESV